MKQKNLTHSKITENNVIKDVTQFLRLRGYKVYRTNNTAIYDQIQKRFRRFSGEEGFPDLVAIKKHKRVLFIECKSPTGKVSISQQEFIDLANSTTQLPIALSVNDISKLMALA